MGDGLDEQLRERINPLVILYQFFLPGKMFVPASFMYLTKTSGCTVFLITSDTVIRIRLAPFPATVSTLASIIDGHFLLADSAFVVDIQKEVLVHRLIANRISN